jgi:hypothetical protein
MVPERSGERVPTVSVCRPARTERAASIDQRGISAGWKEGAIAMTPRTLATIAAITSFVFGAVGLVLPQAFATAFGEQLDPLATTLARLACACYIGFALLAWLARDLTDPVAWRAVAGASALSWGLSAVVLAGASLSGIGDARIWAMVTMQVVFAVAWSVAYVRVARTAPSAA